MKNILELKNDLTGIGHGLSLNKVQSPNSLITRATNELLSEVDVFESVQEKQIANSIYDSIYDYPCEEDLKMDKVIDIYPQVNRLVSDKFDRRYIEDFDRKKGGASETFSVEYRNGVKILRLSRKSFSPSLTPTSIGDFGSLTGNGTWVLTNDTNDLSIDTVNYITGRGSLRFNADDSGTVWAVENDGIMQNSISAKKDGSVFLWVFLPDASAQTDVTLRIGSSPTDYYEQTVTSAYSTSFVNGWNQLEFPFHSMTVVGTPDDELITYLRVSGQYDGTEMQGVRVDSCVTILGTKYLVKYYSDRIFKDAVTGELKSTVTNDADIIMLEDTSYNGLLYKCAEFMAQQVQNQGGSIDLEYFLGLYMNWKNRYMSAYRSQMISPKQSYWSSSTYGRRPLRTYPRR